MTLIMAVHTQSQDPFRVDAANAAIGAGTIVDGAVVAAMDGPGEILPAAGVGAVIGTLAVLGAGLSRGDRFTQATARVVGPVVSVLTEGVYAVAKDAPGSWPEYIATGARAALAGLSSLATTRYLTTND